jgi:large subunit ribosomal protein L7A
MKLISEEKLGRVFVALDADASVTREVIAAAEEKRIPISYIESMKRLGKQFGIDTGASCAGVLS